MKAILMSIRPKWVEMIASGKKTVEVRRTKPKIDVPFKCYIYCTKGEHLWKTKDRVFLDGAYNRVIDDLPDYLLGGKVIGEFVCNQIGTTSWINTPDHPLWRDGFCEEICLTNRELYDYSKGGIFYEWYISDLVIYDKPKELSEFKQIKIIRGYHKKGETKIEKLLKGSRFEVKYLTRPPQSWCYCEELKGERE